VSATVDDLAPATTYHYRLVATNAAGTAQGADGILTTAPAVVPVVATGAATGFSATSATLNGSVNPNGRPATWYFEYGTSTGYGTKTPSQNAGSGTSASAVSAPVTGLKAGRMYHFRLVASSDAGTSKGGDSSAGVRMGRDRQGIYYVEDVVRGQWSSAERNAIMLQTAKLDGTEVAVWCEQEPGASGKESAELTVKLLAGFAIYTESVSGSKEVRAEPFAAQAEAGNVRLVRGPWNGAYIEELCSFPNGKNDDQVDGSSGAFNKLQGVWGTGVAPQAYVHDRPGAADPRGLFGLSRPYAVERGLFGLGR